MNSYTSQDWSSLWYNSIFIFTLIVALFTMLNGKPIKIASALVAFFGIGIIFYFVTEPIALYSDKYAYKMSFDGIFSTTATGKTGDSGFALLTKIIKFITDSYFLYFFFIALISIDYFKELFNLAIRYTDS